jgi:peptide/nickel transport system substrate-binding protein/oligopeptide transport system substrate-binding protein
VPTARKPALAVLILAVASTAVSCASAKDAATGSAPHRGVKLQSLAASAPDDRVGKSGGTFRMAIGEPAAIDPFNAQESEGQLVTKNLFDTLVTVDPSGKLQKQLAADYSRNADCSQWTFDLKAGQRFSNGEAVDAESIRRGMTRAALGKAASDEAYHMAGIQGFDALQANKATSFTGVLADGLRLTVKLSAPDCEFDLKTTQPVFSPVPPEAGAASNTAYNDQPIGNGPFMLAGPWQHDKSITLVRNPNYTDGPEPLLSKVELTIYSSDSHFEYAGLVHGDFDYARVMPDDLQAAANRYYRTSRDASGFIKYPSWGVNYLLTNVRNAPLNSVAARQAVSYAIDRNAIVNGVLKNSVTVATSLVSPAFASQGTYQAGVCASCAKQDPAKARAAAAKAGLPPGSKVSITYSTGGGVDGWIQAIGGELNSVLGWKVDLKPEPFKETLQNEADPKASGLFRDGWVADYPTSWDFLAPLLGTQPADNPGDNLSAYSNRQVDQLLAAGLAQPDAAKRAADYRNAEQIAIGQDLALIPLWYRTEYRAFDASKWVGVNNDFFENPTLRTIGLK